MFYCADTDPADLCPKAEPRGQRGLTLYTLAAGYRREKQSSTDIWLHVTPLATSFSQGYVTFFMFQFFKFYVSLCALPSLPPASVSEHSLFLIGLHVFVYVLQFLLLLISCFIAL
jgi:hypothetical protein